MANALQLQLKYFGDRHLDVLKPGFAPGLGGSITPSKICGFVLCFTLNGTVEVEVN